jgi:hypothetical protein
MRNKKAYSRLDFVINNNVLSKSKRSQLTVFIILAVAIVIIAVLLLIQRGNLPAIFTAETPISQIKNCITGNAEETGTLKNLVSKLSMQGGTLLPKNYYLYEDNKIEYLCYTEENYKKCVMQKPLLKKDIENELKKEIKPKVDSCIESFKNSYQNKGYAVSSKQPEISVELVPNSVVVSLNNFDLKIVKEKTENYNSVRADFSSKLYNFVMIVSSIGNWETRFGDSETMIYMISYPSMKVEKKKQGDGTNVYILTDKETSEKFMFASKSLVLPSGITGK